MAFKLKAPFLNKPTSSYQNLDSDTPSFSQNLQVTDINADGVENTETEEPESNSAIDQFISENEGDESGGRRDNEFLQQRVDKARNPRQEAKLKLRLARRQKRQEESAKRKYAKGNVQLGLDEGVLSFDELSAEDQKKYTDPKAAEKAAAKQKELEDKVAKEITQEMENDKDLQEEMANEQPIIEDVDSPASMTVNRAGRSKQSGVLMTSPIVKSYKQSHKGAVGMMKMQSIAQDLTSPNNYSPLENDPPKKSSDKKDAPKKIDWSKQPPEPGIDLWQEEKNIDDLEFKD